MNIDANIRKKRLEQDMDQQELAKFVNVSKTFICNIEKGVRQPSLKMITKIADRLHCSIDELLDRKVS